MHQGKKEGTWTGEERRAAEEISELAKIWEMLHAMNNKLDIHIAEAEQYRPKINELTEILAKSKGAVALLKLLVYIGTPLYAVILWAKDHIKW